MRVTALKTIYLTKEELKIAIYDYITDADLCDHLYENDVDMGWTQDGKEFFISMDGEFNQRFQGMEITGSHCGHCHEYLEEVTCSCTDPKTGDKLPLPPELAWGQVECPCKGCKDTHED